MNFYLMHKDLIVARFAIDMQGNPSKVMVNEVNREHIPVGWGFGMQKINEWWKNRSVPKTRHGVTNALRQLGVVSTDSMLVNNLALSLNDCYWIKPDNEQDLMWCDVSLFRNNFVDIFGELTFDKRSKFDMCGKILCRTATSQGELQKKWCIDDNGNRFLVKGNWGTTCQQSLNEVFASEIHSRQQVVSFVQYALTSVPVDGGRQGIGCYCYNFCSEQMELVSAAELLESVKRGSAESWYMALKRVCRRICGFTEEYIDRFLGYQIMVDYLITNTDRHMNNIAVLRNPDTLEYCGFAPIYDSGNSMFFRDAYVPDDFYDVQVTSFTKWERDLIRLVRDRRLIDITNLPSKEAFYSVYGKNMKDVGRVNKLWGAFQQKVCLLERFQGGEHIWADRWMK